MAQDRPLPAWRHLWRCYRDPFNLLLSALALVSVLTSQAQPAAVIGAMVLLSTGLRFIQEKRASRAAQALTAYVAHSARVRRPDARPFHRVPAARLVPGDILILSAGDMVAADARLIESKDLFVSQSALTGESLPIERQANQAQTNLVFMGSSIVSGTGVAVVFATGDQTEFGRLAKDVSSSPEAPSAFQTQIKQLGGLLLRVVLVMVPLVFLINALTKGDLLQAALFALSVGVGLTPEMLPMVVTSILARGATVMSRSQVIVKRLEAIHTLGAMDVLCTDKTGTLTEDRVSLTASLDAFGTVSDSVLHLAQLNSRHQTGLRNTLDAAVLSAAQAAGVSAADAMSSPASKALHKLDEVPFDFRRRRMSVLLAREGSAPLLITKGAAEELLAVCAWVREGERISPLTSALRARVEATLLARVDQGLRVIAVASREYPPGTTTCRASDEQDLVLEGFLVFEDPPRASSHQALSAMGRAGIAVKVLTGDHPRVAARICGVLGLPAAPLCIGPQIDALDEHQLRQRVESTTVFAQLDPIHKARIVQALRANGHRVGFLGDGINDAPALRAADVGISVHTAVDIARESSDIVLLEKSLTVLVQGVLEGRRTEVKLKKYVHMTVSSNFGNVLSILAASLLLPFLPMLPVHLLLQNFLYDLTQSAIPFDAVDDDELVRPRGSEPEDLLRFMLWFGPLSSAFDLIAFAVLWFGFGANSSSSQSLFQSGWFVVGLLSQTLVVHSLRTARVPWIQSRAAPAVVLGSVTALVLAVWLVHGPLAASLQLQPLPGLFWVFALGMLLAYLIAVHWLKRAFIRRHGWP